MADSPILREDLIDLCDAVLPRVKWRFIHIPKTGGTAFRKRYGHGTVPGDAHWPARRFGQVDVMFAFLRNPFDRAVSLCAYLHGRTHLTRDTFAGWVGRGCRSDSHPAIGWGISAPQAWWLDDRVERVQYEALQDEMPYVANWIGEPLEQLPRENVSMRDRDWRTYYDDETAAAVRTIYKEDFDLGLWEPMI